MEDPTRREFAQELIGVTMASGSDRDEAIRAVRRKDWEPAYLGLEKSGELARRAKALREVYGSCRLCPRRCGVNRLKGEKGVCRGSARVKLSGAHPHFGEERCLVGRGGSGTVFFSHCNLLCEYCQNWNISHSGDGEYASDDDLARMMLDLQRRGCHNINVVTPTHFVPNIVAALRSAIYSGLRLPLVYNCGGYEPVEIVRLLDGVVDIYLPDYKYSDPQLAGKYSRGANDYPEVARAAIEEMHRQVGYLTLDEKGIALRGLMIRHLVLPQNQAGTGEFVKWVAARLGPATYVNIMAQYRPEFRAKNYPELSRRITTAEYEQAVSWARAAGLRNLDAG